MIIMVQEMLKSVVLITKKDKVLYWVQKAKHDSLRSIKLTIAKDRRYS